MRRLQGIFAITLLFGALAVLPGTTHITLMAQTDLLLAIVPPFLDAPMPTAR